MFCSKKKMESVYGNEIITVLYKFVGVRSQTIFIWRQELRPASDSKSDWI